MYAAFIKPEMYKVLQNFPLFLGVILNTPTSMDQHQNRNKNTLPYKRTSFAHTDIFVQTCFLCDKPQIRGIWILPFTYAIRHCFLINIMILGQHPSQLIKYLQGLDANDGS